MKKPRKQPTEDTEHGLMARRGAKTQRIVKKQPEEYKMTFDSGLRTLDL